MPCCAPRERGKACCRSMRHCGLNLTTLFKAGVFMSNPSSDSTAQKKKIFSPKPENYKVSLKYEGMLLKEENEHRSIAELKRKYAR